MGSACAEQVDPGIVCQHPIKVRPDSLIRPTRTTSPARLRQQSAHIGSERERLTDAAGVEVLRDAAAPEQLHRSPSDVARSAESEPVRERCAFGLRQNAMAADRRAHAEGPLEALVSQARQGAVDELGGVLARPSAP